FEDLDVPPTLVSFAVTTGKTKDVVSGEFKHAGNPVIILRPETDENGLPKAGSVIENIRKVTSLIRENAAVSAYTPAYGGIAEAVYKMCIGNGLGFKYAEHVKTEDIFAYSYGSFILETTGEIVGETLGYTTEDKTIRLGSESLALSELSEIYEGRLESVYPCMEKPAAYTETFSYNKKEIYVPNIKIGKPRVLIPVFPGTNCEYDTAKVMEDAGAESRIFVINNLTKDGITRSVDEFAKEVGKSQMIFLPGGFSGGDEPDGSGKFIMAFFRNAKIKESVRELLGKRDGLMCGICNGFQALIKLGLVPFGDIVDTDENCPTLTFNKIARHQSKLVRIRVSSNKSPWLKNTEVGDVYTVPVSHGEGRFYASDEVIKRLAENGQIATQYVDLDGNATEDIRFNPNGSAFAIEGITSPDGRVFGKMGHSERTGDGLYKNVEGNYDMKMFKSAVEYFTK
ncbi:MAG TPA: phosphoribosylformylglycinamidine synthase, partial [Clostridiales bacterium]|nr:phosphoribosylformylglycinamidine synthase [Clostridiales bacterium]